MPSTVISMRDVMSWTYFISAPRQGNCVAVTLEAVIQALCFVYWQFFVAWLPVSFREFWLCVVIGCFLYGTWSQRLQSLYYLASWAPSPHVCISCLNVLKVWVIEAGFWELYGACSLFSKEFHPTIIPFLWNMKDPGWLPFKRH